MTESLSFPIYTAIGICYGTKLVGINESVLQACVLLMPLVKSYIANAELSANLIDPSFSIRLLEHNGILLLGFLLISWHDRLFNRRDIVPYLYLLIDWVFRIQITSRS